MSKEITLGEFINLVQEKATEKQLDMSLRSIGAGTDGNWHIMTSNCELGISCREEILIPIYKEEK